MKRYIIAMIALLSLQSRFLAMHPPGKLTPIIQASNSRSAISWSLMSRADFTKASGVVTIDDKDISNLKVELTIDAASVSTDHVKRDEHFRGPDFFDVAKYPTISFRFEKGDQGWSGQIESDRRSYHPRCDPRSNRGRGRTNSRSQGSLGEISDGVQPPLRKSIERILVLHGTEPLRQEGWSSGTK